MSAVSCSVSENGWPVDLSHNGHGQQDGPLHCVLVMRILSGHYPIPIFDFCFFRPERWKGETWSLQIKTVLNLGGL